MRIARAIALAGIASRRKSEEHILNGAIRVNGEVVKDLGRQVDPDQDVLMFRGRTLQFNQFVYFLLNKPSGYTTTAGDPKIKKTVYALLPKNLMRGSRQPDAKKTRVFPVGRLDRDTTGLLLFTNDGSLGNRLMHPRYGVQKIYEARLDHPFDMKFKKKLLAGVRLKDGMAKVEKVHVCSKRVVRVTLAEGRNHEVKRIFEKIGYKVVRLARLTLGPLRIGNIPQGYGRYLTRKEIETLKNIGK